MVGAHYGDILEAARSFSPTPIYLANSSDGGTQPGSRRLAGRVFRGYERWMDGWMDGAMLLYMPKSVCRWWYANKRTLTSAFAPLDGLLDDDPAAACFRCNWCCLSNTLISMDRTERCMAWQKHSHKHTLMPWPKVFITIIPTMHWFKDVCWPDQDWVARDEVDICLF